MVLTWTETFSFAINQIVYALMLKEHHDIWLERRQKFVSSFEELFLVDLYVKEKFLKHCKPQTRKTGISVKRCERCGRFGAHIKSYGINLCRHCFREVAEEIGFKKYS